MWRKHKANKNAVRGNGDYKIREETGSNDPSVSGSAPENTGFAGAHRAQSATGGPVSGSVGTGGPGTAERRRDPEFRQIG